MQLTITTQVPKLQQFIKHTQTFKLTIKSEKSEPTLKFILYDYTDWVIYSKEITDKQISEQKCGMINLQYIYDCFCFTGIANDQQTQQVQQSYRNKYIKLDEYTFGDIVKVNDQPCYKIGKGGCITIYRNILDLKINKQINFQIKLVLAKMRDMSQVQILNQKLQIEKMHHFQANCRQLSKSKLNQQLLTEKIVTLQNKNIELQTQLRKTKQEMEKMKNMLMEQINKLKNQTNESRNKMNQLNVKISSMPEYKNKPYFGKSKQWQAYSTDSTITIKYNHLGLTKVPLIFTSLHGNSGIWVTTGTTSIYSATNTQFQVYIKGLGPAALKQQNAHLHYQIIPQQ